MSPELKERILKYNKKVAEDKEKAADLEIIVKAFMGLPPGQLKKVLTEEVLDVFSKYGVVL